MTGLSINVGRILNAEIKAAIRPIKVNQSIGFPSLITKLCEEARLKRPHASTERIPVFKELVWDEYIKKETVQPQEEGDQEKHEEEDEEEATAEDGTQAAPSSPRNSKPEFDTQYDMDMEAVFEHLDNIRDQITEFQDEQVRIQRRQVQLMEAMNGQKEAFNKLNDEVSDFIRYQVAFNRFLASDQPGPPPTYPLPRPLPPPGPQ